RGRVTMPSETGPPATGSKTVVTYVGTGPTGATLDGGPVKKYLAPEPHVQVQDHVVHPVKRSPDDVVADIDVVRDVKMSVVTVKMITDGISFDDGGD
ncbi:hypothetical protein DH86_00004356, partial [Scytalidium sp. 3C]